MTPYEYFKSLKSEKIELADWLSQNLTMVKFKNGSVILNRKTAKWDWRSDYTPPKEGVKGKDITMEWLGLKPGWPIHETALFLLQTKVAVAVVAEPGRKEWLYGVTAPGIFTEYIAEGVLTAEEFKEVVRYWFWEKTIDDIELPRDKRELLGRFGFFKKEGLA